MTKHFYQDTTITFCMISGNNTPKKTTQLSDLVEHKLAGLSPIQTIMKMAEEDNIKKMGLNPKEVISFGGGWCNHKAPDQLQQAYQHIIEDNTLFHQSGRYSAIIGDATCRNMLARFEQNIFNIPTLEAENIILGQSSTQLFHDLLRVICNDKTDVALLDPTYANYANAITSALPNSKVHYINALDTTNWSYLTNPQYSLEQVKSHFSKKTKALIIPVPDNPTSQIPPHDFLKACLEIAQDSDGFLVLDHAYKALWFDEMPPCFSWSPEDYPNLITIHSNSKWLSSLGRRLGWIEASHHVIAGLEKTNESVLLSPDTMHSMATAQFLEKTLEDGTLKDYIEQTRTVYQKTSNVLTNGIQHLLQWDFLKPMGGLYTCCPTPSNQDPNNFVEKLLKNTGVLLIPGTGFGPSMNHALRLSYGPLCYDHEKIQEGLERVSNYLEKRP